MQTVSKYDVANWMLLDYAAQKQALQEKISGFEKKYSTNFQAFELKINQMPAEEFAAWDDYIDWQASQHFLVELLAKIDDIRHGDFQVA